MSKTPDYTHCYIGRRLCGCVVAVTVDGTRHTAKDVRDFIKDGLTIERITIEALRESVHLGCKHQAKQPALVGMEGER